MKRLTRLAAAAATATVVVALAGCGDGASPTGVDAERTAPNGDVFNSADIAFATQMIPHHAQALTMVDLTRGRDLSPELERLTADIQAAQAPEIELMVGWLTDWGEQVPETMRDHVNAEEHGASGDHGGDHAAEMPGMMTDTELGELETAQGQAFEALWLEMMIEHHEGAIEMARVEQADGAFQPARELAESIETSQQAEIDLMNELLGS